jgi:hypothetical protein
MRVLTYKRTHTGDPDARGIFGSSDCMGSVRDLAFDAVVGIGSLSPWRDDEAIAGKITWIGVGPHRSRGSWRGAQVSFDRFLLLDGEGPKVAELAPALAQRFYVRNARWMLRSYSPREKQELDRLITLLLKDPRCVTSHRPLANVRHASKFDTRCDRSPRTRRHCARIC